MTKTLVVADSSSLIISAKAHIIEIMCREFDLLIPEAVFNESVVSGKALEKPDAAIISQMVNGNKIRVKSAVFEGNRGAQAIAADFRLGKGESEAIALFLQEEADLLLVDDRKGIGVSKALEISWATVPDMIVYLKRAEKLSYDSAIMAIDACQKEGRYKIGFIMRAIQSLESGVKK